MVSSVSSSLTVHNWSTQLAPVVTDKLIPLLEALLKKADDTLFDMSERATSTDKQQRFFDAMRDLRVSQKSIIASVVRDLKTPPALDGQDVDEPSYDFDSLSLIDEAEMEETVALESMSARAVDQGAEPYSDYVSRIEEGLSQTYKPQQVPLGPYHIAKSFLGALKSRDYDVTVTLILFKLFERHVGAEIDTLYEEANRILIDDGLLPDLKTRKKQSRRASSKSDEPEEEMGLLGQLLQAMQGGTQSPTAAMNQGLGNAQAMGGFGMNNPALNGAQGQFAGGPLAGGHFGATPQGGGYHSGGGPHGGGDGNPANGSGANGVAPTGSEGGFVPVVALSPSPNLYTGLHQVQNQVLDMQMSPQQVSQQLQSQLHYSTQHHSNEMVTHGAVINLVALLFDFILEDHQLQPEMKQLIARLQVPFVKVALLDKGFFEKNEHPARLLLNRLAEAATGWQKQEDDGLYETLESCVHGVLRDFDEDISLFEDSLQALEAKMQPENEQHLEIEKNLVRIERTKTVADAATRAGRAIIDRVLDNHPVAPSFQPVLRQAWLQVLFRLYYKQGGSRPWRQACKVANALAWSLQPDSAFNREHYEKTTRQVMSAVRKGLAAIQYSHPQIDERLLAIEDFWQRQLLRDDESANDGLAIVLNEDDQQASLGSLDLADDELDDVLGGLGSEDADEEEAIDEQWLDLVTAMTPGSWCEQLLEDQWLRIKLADILPQSGRYLFVNRAGVKQASLSKSELALALRAGRIRLIENSLLFDRALSSVIESLRIAI